MRRTFLVLAAALGGAALTAACGPDWDALDPSLGGGSATGSVGHGGAGAATTTSSSSGAGAGVTSSSSVSTTSSSGSTCNGQPDCCDQASDCPGMDSACSQRTCTDHTCGVSLTPSGTLLPQSMQTPGDCKDAVCNGMGGVTTVEDDNDVPVEPSTCIQGMCTGGTPSSTDVSAGTACSDGGGKECDGHGHCVGCLAASDCGTNGTCATWTCNQGMCGGSFAAAGTSCGAGEQCNGAGACTSCQPTSASTFTSSDTPQSSMIPDSTVTSHITVSGLSNPIVDVNATIDVSNGGMFGGGTNDLTIQLTSPGGTKLYLSNKRGSSNSGNNFAGTTFDDSAPTRVTLLSYTNAVVTSAIPEQDLGQLIGQSANGMWTLSVSNTFSSDSGPTITSWSIQITTQAANPPLSPATFTSTTSMAIPDDSTAGITSTIPVSGLGPSIYLATVTVQIQHPRPSDLTFSLVPPGSGPTVLLSQKAGGSTANLFSDTTFEDAAAKLLGCNGSDCASTSQPLTTVVPEGSLSALVGADPNGTWSLDVADTVSGDTGTLEGWSLTLTPVACPIAP